MPRKKILSSLQKEMLEKLPERFAELAKHYLLTSQDLEFISQRRRSSNKLGFAVSLCLMRYPGRTLKIDEIPPKPMISFSKSAISKCTSRPRPVSLKRAISKRSMMSLSKSNAARRSASSASRDVAKQL